MSLGTDDRCSECYVYRTQSIGETRIVQRFLEIVQFDISREVLVKYDDSGTVGRFSEPAGAAPFVHPHRTLHRDHGLVLVNTGTTWLVVVQKLF